MHQWDFVRCLYDEASQHEAILQVLALVRRSVQWIRAVKQPDNDDAYQGAVKVWSHWFARLAPAIKHQAFDEEQEWRLISAPVPLYDSRWQVRAGRSMLIPYIPITPAPSGTARPIQDIVVGPTPHMELSLRAACTLLGLNLDPTIFEGPTLGPPPWVRKSRIPYRNW